MAEPISSRKIRDSHLPVNVDLGITAQVVLNDQPQDSYCSAGQTKVLNQCFPINRVFAQSSGIQVEVTEGRSNEEIKEKGEKERKGKMHVQSREIQAVNFHPNRIYIIDAPDCTFKVIALMVNTQGVAQRKNTGGDGEKEDSVSYSDRSLYVPLRWKHNDISSDKIEEWISNPTISKVEIKFPQINYYTVLANPIKEKNASDELGSLLRNRPEADYYEEKIRAFLKGEISEIKPYLDPAFAATLSPTDKAWYELSPNVQSLVSYISQTLIISLERVKSARKVARENGQDIGDPEGNLLIYDKNYVENRLIPFIKQQPQFQNLQDIQAAMIFLNTYYFIPNIGFTSAKEGVLRFDAKGFTEYVESIPPR